MTVATPSDLEGVFKGLGLSIAWLDQSKGEIYARCPQHRKRTGKEDRHPSWSLNRSTGDHNCFSCGYSGDIVRQVMDLKYPNDVFAARRWLRQFGVDLDAAMDIPDWDEWEVKRDSKRLSVPFGEAWLELHDPPPDEALEDRGISREAAEEFGLLWNYEKGCWILPIYAADGTFLGWQEKAKGYFRNHPEGIVKHETLFGIRQFKEGSMAILLESPLDCVRLASEGITGGLSSMGVKVSDEQMSLLIDLTDTVMLALDNDKDGMAMTTRLLKKYRKRIHLLVANYDKVPERKDFGEMTYAEITTAMREARHSTEVPV